MYLGSFELFELLLLLLLSVDDLRCFFELVLIRSSIEKPKLFLLFVACLELVVVLLVVSESSDATDDDE